MTVVTKSRNSRCVKSYLGIGGYSKFSLKLSRLECSSFHMVSFQFLVLLFLQVITLSHISFLFEDTVKCYVLSAYAEYTVRQNIFWTKDRTYTRKRNLCVSQKGKDEIAGGKKKSGLINFGRFPNGPSRRFLFDEPFHDDSALVIRACDSSPRTNISRCRRTLGSGKLKRLRRRRRKASGTVKWIHKEAYAICRGKTRRMATACGSRQ